MSAKLYHNSRCSKSRQALSLLQDRGVSMTVIDYIATPPSSEEFSSILRKLGKPAKALLRAKEAAEENIESSLPESDLIEAMIAHPRVIERPIFVTDVAARIGRPPELVLEIIPE